MACNKGRQAARRYQGERAAEGSKAGARSTPCSHLTSALLNPSCIRPFPPACAPSRAPLPPLPSNPAPLRPTHPHLCHEQRQLLLHDVGPQQHLVRHHADLGQHLAGGWGGMGWVGCGGQGGKGRGGEAGGWRHVRVWRTSMWCTSEPAPAGGVTSCGQRQLRVRRWWGGPVVTSRDWGARGGEGRVEERPGAGSMLSCSPQGGTGWTCLRPAACHATCRPGGARRAEDERVGGWASCGLVC